MLTSNTGTGKSNMPRKNQQHIHLNTPSAGFSKSYSIHGDQLVFIVQQTRAALCSYIALIFITLLPLFYQTSQRDPRTGVSVVHIMIDFF